ncbi:MAG: Ldh family oxidoreductase [Synergistetes bacterium]|nr:Ldh family oxidoreductase [Synergistota bacterium]
MSVFVPYERLKGLVAEIFVKLNLSREDAFIMAEALLSADLRGVESHGVLRLPTYVRRIKLGLIKANPDIKVVRESKSSVLFDADNGLGQVAATFAMKACIRKARDGDLAIAGVRRSNHVGICAYYAMMALKENMIGFFSTNTAALMAPYGGCEPLLGTNPFAVAIPAGQEFPIVLDMSTSVVPRGKIEMSLKEGKKIPPTWAIDRDGNPTEDPKEALEGALLPLGGPKGYGLSIVIDILSGLLMGSSYGREIKSMFTDFTKPMGVGHFMMAIKVESFMPIEEFKARVDEYIRTIKNSKKAKGVKEILLPGERSWKTERERLKKGIPLSEKAMEALKEAMSLVNLDFDGGLSLVCSNS